MVDWIWCVNPFSVDDPRLRNGENMIKEIHEKDIAECVNVIKESFLTVADELGYTVDNAPRFTAFVQQKIDCYINTKMSIDPCLHIMMIVKSLVIIRCHYKIIMSANLDELVYIVFTQA